MVRTARPSASGLSEEALGAMVDAWFPAPRRRRKTASSKKAKTKGRSKAPSAGKARANKAPPPGRAPALGAVAAVAGDPGAAESFFDPEVLGLIRQAAEALATEVDAAAAAHDAALEELRASQPAPEPLPAAAESQAEPAFLRLLPDDFDDDETPLEVFDVDALCEEMGVREEEAGSSTGQAAEKDESAPAAPAPVPPQGGEAAEGDVPTVPATADAPQSQAGPAARPGAPPPLPRPPTPVAARPALAAAVAEDPREWHAMVDYLSSRRLAAQAGRAARRLRRRAAATVAEYSPQAAGCQTPAAHLAIAGVLLLGWAVTFYRRTGDLRTTVGMLAWASCAACVLALVRRPR